MKQMDSVTGTVTDIQRFSLHDGPGIRTTVFLKGCSLRCFWCHNPETVRLAAEIQFLPEKCIGCGECVRVCEQRAHVVQDGIHAYLRDRCRGCGACTDVCFSSVLQLIGRRMTGEEVVQEVLRDRPFYDDSGGGVTLSGGEPVLQWEFARAILERCKEEGIHTAIETAGNYPWRQLAQLLPSIDLVMMDIKHMDPQRHYEGTGVDNTRILANARRLAATDLPLVFRVPVVPTFNDTRAEVEAIAEFVGQLQDLRIGKGVSPASPIALELLPFHPLAAHKYRGLGVPNRAEGLQIPSKENMAELVEVAGGQGIEVIG